MKKIIFLRPAPYKDILDDKDLVTSFDLVGKQKFDINVDQIPTQLKKKISKFMEDFEFKNIISSPSLRAQETAKYFSKSYTISNKIKELKFSLKKDVPKKFLKQTDDFSVNILRYELVKAFTKNKTTEKKASVLNRIKKHMITLKKSEGSTICFSHAFIMKFYEIFLVQKERTTPNMFLEKYSWTEKPYDFLEGFCVEINDKNEIGKLTFISIPNNIW